VKAAVTRTGKRQWAHSGVSRLIELVKKQVKTVRMATEAGERGEATSRPPSFGHRREIRRVITLANALVEGALARGMRNVPDVVTEDVVNRIWKSSFVSLGPPGAGGGAAGYDPQPSAGHDWKNPPWTIEHCCDAKWDEGGRVPRDTLEYCILKVLDENSQGLRRAELTMAVNEMAAHLGLKVKKTRGNAIASRVTALRKRMKKLRQHGCDLDLPGATSQRGIYRLRRRSGAKDTSGDTSPP
jgi:hypothetical protein